MDETFLKEMEKTIGKDGMNLIAKRMAKQIVFDKDTLIEPRIVGILLLLHDSIHDYEKMIFGVEHGIELRKDFPDKDKKLIFDCLNKMYQGIESLKEKFKKSEK